MTLAVSMALISVASKVTDNAQLDWPSHLPLVVVRDFDVPSPKCGIPGTEGWTCPATLASRCTRRIVRPSCSLGCLPDSRQYRWHIAVISAHQII